MIESSEEMRNKLCELLLEGASVSTMADEIGIGRISLTQFLRGRGKAPQFVTLLKINRYLKLKNK